MEVKELLEKLKKVVTTFIEEKQTPTPHSVKLIEQKLKDGTVMVCDPTFEVGAECVLKLPEGDVPAKDGDYELEDGTICTTKDGKIESIITPELMMKEQITKQAETIKDIQKENTSLKSQIEEIKISLVAFKSNIDNSKEVNKTMLEIVTVLSEASGALSTNPQKNPFFVKQNKVNSLISSLPKIQK